MEFGEQMTTSHSEDLATVACPFDTKSDGVIKNMYVHNSVL